MADTRNQATAAELLEAGETALKDGNSRQAFDLLHRAAQFGVAPRLLDRLARAFARAGRYQSRHTEVRDWIEQSIAGAPGPELRLALLRARIAVCRQIDVFEVEDMIDEALAAADALGDDSAYAAILADGSFVAYRRGDSRIANRYAELAASRGFEATEAQYAVARTQMFAAVVAGKLERAVELSISARELARAGGDTANVANEYNNLAEFYLDLGFPHEGKECAEQAIELARESGHRAVEQFAQSMSANATALIGSIDEALDQFAAIQTADLMFAVDAATAHTFWLLERGAAGDAEAARYAAITALDKAERAGVLNRLTALYGNLARSFVRLGERQAATRQLERARQSAERAEQPSQLLLALAIAEVLPATDPKRKVVLNQARVRVLRNAEHRRDPRAYCTGVRLNRRLLELSGGIPSDLPSAAS